MRKLAASLLVSTAAAFERAADRLDALAERLDPHALTRAAVRDANQQLDYGELKDHMRAAALGPDDDDLPF